MERDLLNTSDSVGDECQLPHLHNGSSFIRVYSG